MSRLMQDPVEQFEELFGHIAVPQSPLSSEALRQVLAAPFDAGDRALNSPERIDAVADYVARNSTLTYSSARARVQPKLDQAAQENLTPAQAAEDVASAVPAIAARVSLDTASMLTPPARIVFAAISAAGAVAAVISVYLLSIRASVPTAGLATLAVMGVLFLLADLILIMGYQKVSISGSSGDSSGAEQ
jgi:hypothetical protein